MSVFEDYYPHLLIILLLLVVIFFAVDYFCGESFTKSAVVLEKSYTPPSSTVGTGFTSDGKTAVTTTHHPEQWTLIAELPNGDIITYSTNKQFWLSAEKGDEVSLEFTKGLITGIEY